MASPPPCSGCTRATVGGPLRPWRASADRLSERLGLSFGPARNTRNRACNFLFLLWWRPPRFFFFIVVRSASRWRLSMATSRDTQGTHTDTVCTHPHPRSQHVVQQHSSCSRVRSLQRPSIAPSTHATAHTKTVTLCEPLRPAALPPTKINDTNKRVQRAARRCVCICRPTDNPIHVYGACGGVRRGRVRGHAPTTAAHQWRCA